MGDVDVLTSSFDTASAVRALTVLGYREVCRSEVEVCLSPASPRGFLPAVDLHARLDYVGQFDIPFEELLRRAAEFHGLPVFTPEDEILALAAHAARHRFRGVGRSVADAWTIARTAHVSWDDVARRARKWRMSVTTWALLSCAARSLGAPIPRATLAALRPSAAKEAYLRAWLDLGHVSPWRLASRGYSNLPRRFALVVLWPALVDGVLWGARHILTYSARVLAHASPGISAARMVRT
jgi:hypothetical protein